MKTLVLILVMSLLQSGSFKESQLKNTRVKEAYRSKEETVKAYFVKAKVDYTNFDLFIRVFKKESILEAWAKNKKDNTFTLVHSYSICSSSGTLGPKRKEGDLQVPEGIYQLNHFNPVSNFYLSLGVSYPNASDKILSDKQHPGGAIYIHGNCVTVGCMPLTDDKIKELYVMAVEAKNHGQSKIAIHIFPSKLSASNLAILKDTFGEHDTRISFWNNLKTIYDDFEQTHVLRDVRVGKDGSYHF